MSDKIVAFLDLLGFSSFAGQDKDGAIRMLQDYVIVLNSKITEDKLHPPSSYPLEIKDLAKRKSIDTFSCILPFSDSIFVISEDKDPTIFLTQLGDFILESFMLGQRGRIHAADPISVPVKSLTLQNGQVNVQEKNEKWFPVLFRGGVVYGDVEIAKVPSIIDKQIQATHFAVGKAVVDAVSLEKEKLRCPAILLSPCLVEKIQDAQFKQSYIGPYKQNSQLLWPAFNYDPSDDFNKFSEIFSRAVVLWKYYSHLECSDVYFNFLKLIIKSTMSLFRGTSESFVRNEINKQIDNLAMTSKKDALWEE